MDEAIRLMVRDAIQRSRKKQAEIAEEIGVSLQDLNGWLRKGGRTIPEKHVPKLAVALDLSPDAINDEAADRWRRALKLHPPPDRTVRTEIGTISTAALAIARAYEGSSSRRRQIVDLLFSEWEAPTIREASPKPRRQVSDGTT